ncbi:hypothetical protein E4K66_30725 [Bradyrhizobium frederickii]|uniref:Right handed beta helix domain-containing protein n=1 Tax=Bradyrhizobium frederickii TaxID=2560054 RepID=A0A4Y9KXN1_9BRAD|nr:hypothetical protein [Bradyrhizobium frederickii]TFV34543.1 hypothetical protein E4K66_30725 [Bradyrhizobium frederickii]
MNIGVLPFVASPPIIRSRFDPIFANRDFGIRGLGHEPENDQFQRFLDEGANRQAIIESTLMNIVYTGQLYVRDNCKLIGNGATLTAHPASNIGTTGLHVTDATWAGIGPTGVLIQDLIINGNATARRASGALSGVGQAATVYCVGTKDLVLRRVQSINAAGDGIYIGGNSSTGRLSQRFSVEDCYVEAPGRNCYSVVGTYVGGYRNCVAFNASYGVANGNISYGWDFEPDGPSTLNSGVDCVSCKSMYNQVGFGENLSLGVSTHCNWISCYTEGNSIGFYASGAGFGCRVIGGRVNGNTTNYSTIAEKISGFP